MSTDIPPWILDSVPSDPDPAPLRATPIQTGIYTLQGYHMRETEKAVLFELHGINGAPWIPEDPDAKRQIWFPLSQIKSITHASTSGESAQEYDNMQVKEWILRTKEII